MNSKRRTAKGIKLSTVTFIAVLSIILLTIAITTWVGYREERSSLISTTQELNRIRAEELSRPVKVLADTMRVGVQKTVSMLSDMSLTDASAQKQIDYFGEISPYYNVVFITDKQGRVTAATPRGYQAYIGKHVNFGGKSGGDRGAASADTFSVYDINPNLLGLMNFPIHDHGGEKKGSLIALVFLKEFNIFEDIFGTQDKNENGTYYYVVDSHGTVLYSGDNKKVTESFKENAVVQQLMKGESGGQRVIDADGEEYIAGYAPVEGIGWGIVSQTPMRYIDAQVTKLVRQMVMVSTPYILILFVISIWLSNKLSAPINRLANYASHLSNHANTIEVLPVQTAWNYETNELARAIFKAFRRVKKDHDALTYESKTDALTGLPNRRMMDELLQRWEEETVPYAAIMLDIDKFKLINDTYGHHTGDKVLMFLAEHLQREKRDQDMYCRYGGEEFVLLLPETDLAHAYSIGEQVRKSIEGALSPNGLRVTVSLGVSATELVKAQSKSVLETADEALYEAKQTGRNRTVMYQYKWK